MKVLSIFGTRPEAIKMAPLVRLLMNTSGVEAQVCVTGQHRTMLHQVLDLFDIRPDHDLDLMMPDQTLNSLGALAFASLDPILEAARPDLVLVHGDTTTAMIGALAAFHRRIPIGHVEAGLRTQDLSQPWPEEMNRRVVDAISKLMFAPTARSKTNLERENLAGRIVVTGNTVIDALHMTISRIGNDPQLAAELDSKLPVLQAGCKLLLVTGHRRENFGRGFQNICTALATLAKRPDIQIIYPVHLNPNVKGPVQMALSQHPNVHLIEPLDYLRFVRLMARAHVILTDSGGVQEEAPSLGKPVLVMRNVTERPEAVEAGTVQLVGTDPARIETEVVRLFDDEAAWRAFSQRHNPYGDGHASKRIAAALTGLPVSEFTSELTAEVA
jgi:UDP-N-acetylglucosamine 2-epimerase (non-hydrolysing)